MPKDKNEEEIVESFYKLGDEIYYVYFEKTVPFIQSAHGQNQPLKSAYPLQTNITRIGDVKYYEEMIQSNQKFINEIKKGLENKTSENKPNLSAQQEFISDPGGATC